MGKCSSDTPAGVSYYCDSTPCSSHAECDDGDKCTDDKCDGSLCRHDAKPFCVSNTAACTSQADCADFGPCISSYCNLADGVCYSYGVANCKVGLACKDASACKDGIACTHDLCANGKCNNPPVVCYDGKPCSANYCDPQSGKCVVQTKAGCTPKACSGSGAKVACDDGDKCTQDLCVLGYCSHISAPGCGAGG